MVPLMGLSKSYCVLNRVSDFILFSYLFDTIYFSFDDLYLTAFICKKDGRLTLESGPLSFIYSEGFWTFLDMQIFPDSCFYLSFTVDGLRSWILFFSILF